MLRIVRSFLCELGSQSFRLFGFCALCASLILLGASCARPPVKPKADHKHPFLPKQDVGLHWFEGVKWKVKSPDTAGEVEWFEASFLSLEDLKQIKALRIKTVEDGEEVKSSISQSGTFIDPSSKVSFNKPYYLLDYDVLDVKVSKTDSPESVKSDPQKLLAVLLGKVKNFKGFSGTTYYILPRFVGGWMVLYRVGPPDSIPYDEHFVAEKIGDLMAVPLVGYPIDYCRAIPHQTPYREKTTLFEPECTGVSPMAAEYVRMTYTGKKKFDYKPKHDIYPNDFFEGKWFYVRTVIRTSEAKVTAVGHQPYEPATLVEFHKTSDALKLVDASGEELKEEDKAASLLLSVKWKEYELDLDSEERFKTFGEREKAQKKDTTKSYFQILFDRLTLFGADKAEKEIKNVFLSDDYFSFNLEVHKVGGTPFVVKHAFKREEENPEYPQKQWFEEDSSKFFPVFFVERKYYKDILEGDSQEEEEKFYRVTRFDPRKKEIKWYFSKQTPQTPETAWIRDLGRQGIEFVDREFQEAGKHSDRKIRVTLASDNETRELGDIRYNILNLIVTESAQKTGILGYAPNVSHPVTGEALSATANIWVTQILDDYVDMLRSYIRFNIYPPPWKWQPSYAGVSDFLDKSIHEACLDLRKFIDEGYKGPWFDFHSLFHVKERGASFKKEDFLDEEREKKVIGQCAAELAKPYILQVIIHEIRHGFGYRHIFSASADKDNYYEDYDEIKGIFGDTVLEEVVTEGHHPAPKYASVMDYPVQDRPVLSVPGKCDVMATRFLYFDQVELKMKDGEKEFVNTSSGSQSILQAAKAQRIKSDNIKKCYVCGGRADKNPRTADEDPGDLLCTRFDYGSSPKEVVEYSIEQAYRAAHNNRRFKSDKDSPQNHDISNMSNVLKQFYARWTELRDALFDSLSDQKGVQKTSVWHYSSLISEDTTAYRGLIEEQANKKDKTASEKEFASYYEVRQPIFDFFKQLFFFPTKHCIYKKRDVYQAVSLDVIQIRQEHKHKDKTNREIIRHCQSKEAVDWAAENDKGTFVAEVGAFATDRSYFINPQVGEDKVDEVSLFSAWASSVDKLFPVLNEPDYRAEFFQELENYFTAGLDLNPYISLKERGAFGNPHRVKLDRVLSYEADFLTHPRPMHSVLYVRLMEPLKIINNINRNKTATNSVKYELFKQFEEAIYTRPFLQQTFGPASLAANPEEELKQIMINQDYETNHPLIHDIYEEYRKQEKQKGAQALIAFILKNPLVYSKPDNRLDQRLFIPITRESFPAQVILKLGEYEICIDKDDKGQEQCVDKKAKDTYRDLMHNVLLR